MSKLRKIEKKKNRRPPIPIILLSRKGYVLKHSLDNLSAIWESQNLKRHNPVHCHQGFGSIYFFGIMCGYQMVMKNRSQDLTILWSGADKLAGPNPNRLSSEWASVLCPVHSIFFSSRARWLDRLPSEGDRPIEWMDRRVNFSEQLY